MTGGDVFTAEGCIVTLVSQSAASSPLFLNNRHLIAYITISLNNKITNVSIFELLKRRKSKASLSSLLYSM